MHILTKRVLHHCAEDRLAIKAHQPAGLDLFERIADFGESLEAIVIRWPPPGAGIIRVPEITVAIVTEPGPVVMRTCPPGQGSRKPTFLQRVRKRPLVQRFDGDVSKIINQQSDRLLVRPSRQPRDGLGCCGTNLSCWLDRILKLMLRTIFALCCNLLFYSRKIDMLKKK